jgi:hypothetical protein
MQGVKRVHGILRAACLIMWVHLSGLLTREVLRAPQCVDQDGQERSDSGHHRCVLERVLLAERRFTLKKKKTDRQNA